MAGAEQPLWHVVHLLPLPSGIPSNHCPQGLQLVVLGFSPKPMSSEVIYFLFLFIFFPSNCETKHISQPVQRDPHLFLTS